MLENTMKPSACANVTICSDEERKGLVVSAELPGVKKEDVQLNFTSSSFCLAGERDDLRFDCCYELPCEVNFKESDASFDNGMLRILVPFAEAYRGESIAIH